ncbi:hypothetical protein LCGC14_1118260 [marine sediment metagenome]|uniref:EpsG family protein n=1 Tax=marine sediment metagenome TaxID=412755 RepID=A0A0F9PMW5_9ZZZZ
MVIASIIFTVSKYSWAIISGDFGSYLPESDYLQYLMVAEEGITSNASAPFKYRILTPMLVMVLPFDTILGFYLINLLFIFIASIVFYFYLQTFDFSKELSLIGVILFVVSHSIFYNSFLPMVDALNYLFFALIFYLLRIKKEQFIPIVLMIGVLNHESILLLGITFVLFYRGRKIIAIIVYGMVLFEFFLIRFMVGFDLVRITTIVIPFYIELGILAIILFIGQTYLTTWIGVFYIRKDVFLRKASISYLPILLYMIIAIHLARIIFLTFPIMIPAFLYGLKENISD